MYVCVLLGEKERGREKDRANCVRRRRCGLNGEKERERERERESESESENERKREECTL